MNLDPNFLARAKHLCKDARKSTYAHATAQAVKGWWEEKARLNRIVDNVTIGGLASFGTTLASGAIIGLVGATGVFASVLTFGAAPALALAVGYGLKKGLDEYYYQQKSKRLHASIRAGTVGPERLVDLMAKVLRKYERVVAAHKDLSSSAQLVLTHWGSLPLSQKKMQDQVVPDAARTQERAQMFAKIGHHKELYERLLELRYYAQLMYNTTADLCDTVLARRDALVPTVGFVYAHAARQVHLTGHHAQCRPCYGMPQAEYQAALAGLQPERGAIGDPRAFTQALDRFSQQQMGHARGRAETGQFLSRLHKATRRSASTHDEGPLVLQALDRTPALAVRLGAGGGGSAASHTVSATTTAASAAVGASVGAPLKAVGDELLATYSNRQTRAKVMATGPAASVLLEAEQQAEVEAAQALYADLVKHKDLLKRGPRVAQKCRHYYTKIATMEEEYKEFIRQMSTLGRDFSESRFASCHEAYQAVHAAFYLFNNYTKFIIFLTYLLTVLIQVDAKIAGTVGTHIGQIVGEHRRKPAMPEHLRRRNRFTDDDEADNFEGMAGLFEA